MHACVLLQVCQILWFAEFCTGTLQLLQNFMTVFLISRDNNAINDRDVAELGVFAKKLIPKRTQFGPFVAPTTSKAPRPAAGKFLLTVQYKLFLSLCC